MTRYLALVGALALVLVLPAVAAGDMAAKPVIVMPSQLTWQPSSDLPAGGKIAIIFGDPSKTGYYTVRLSLPDKAAFPVHYHPSAEYVTVLSGTVMVGVGDKVDPSKMVTLPAGSYVEVPAGLHHYAIAKGAVVLQLSGMGPMATIPVKASSM